MTETARTSVVLLFLYIILYVLTSHQLLSNDCVLRIVRQSLNTHQLFPSTHFKAFRTPFCILKVETEQKHAPTLGLLIQTVRLQRYQLWSTLPYAVSPPPVLIYERSCPFAFVSNDEGNVLVIADSSTVSLLRKSDLSRATLGSWKVKQTWTLDEATTTEEAPPPKLSMSRDGTSVVIATTHNFSVMVRLDSDTYYLQPLVVDHVNIDFQLYARSVLAEHNLLVTGVPEFRQTDGVVDIYHFSHQNLELLSIELLQILTPPVRGGYFGGHVVTAYLNTIPLVIISAPFANRGAGAVYIYSRPQPDAMFQVGQIIQGTAPVEQLGRVLAVSENSRFLVVSTARTLCQFEFDSITNTFRHSKVYLHTPYDLQSLHVDNSGNVIYATASLVMSPTQIVAVK